MNKLNFTPVEKAFTLGSSQIKDTQEEINNLTKLILSSKKPEKEPEKNNLFQPDKQTAVFQPSTPQDNIDYNLLKVVGHPKFDDIVRNYVLIYHPEWLLSQTMYVPQIENKVVQNTNPVFSLSTFGNKYSSTVCSDVQNYLLFFIVSAVFFCILSIYFK
jgi:hypothetical protein